MTESLQDIFIQMCEANACQRLAHVKVAAAEAALRAIALRALPTKLRLSEEGIELLFPVEPLIAEDPDNDDAPWPVNVEQRLAALLRAQEFDLQDALEYHQKVRMFEDAEATLHVTVHRMHDADLFFAIADVDDPVRETVSTYAFLPV